ncbi:hypothetical protein [Azospirillum sp.]|uniref:hypothetical protein n=1 Tax=Azospirillum sp. TaxID=34012 RepID=UPI003D712F9D
MDTHDAQTAPAMLSEERVNEIEARYAATTPGRWHWWTSCSWRRLSSEQADGRTKDGGVLCPVVQRSDNHPDCQIRREDMDFIAEAHQDIPALIASHRAQAQTIAALSAELRDWRLSACFGCGCGNEAEHTPAEFQKQWEAALGRESTARRRAAELGAQVQRLTDIPDEFARRSRLPYGHPDALNHAPDVEAWLREVIKAAALPAPSEAPQCTCFGDSGLHASTHGDSQGMVLCDLCGLPVRDDSVDALTAINAPASPEAPAEADTLAAGEDDDEGDDDEAPISPEFRTWLRALEEDVIQGEYGFEPGEFTVYADHWRPLFDEGLTAKQAWRRALDAHAAARAAEDAERLRNWERIKAADARAAGLLTNASEGGEHDTSR